MLPSMHDWKFSCILNVSMRASGGSSTGRAAARRRRPQLTGLDPAVEAEFSRNLALERKVIASDPQSWAYLRCFRNHA